MLHLGACSFDKYEYYAYLEKALTPSSGETDIDEDTESGCALM